MSDAPPAAMVEMLERFYGVGTHRDFERTLGIVLRAPYEPVVHDLDRLTGGVVEDITDDNSEVSFGYFVPPYVVRLSMIGPYCMLQAKDPERSDVPPVDEHHSDQAARIVDVLLAHGFQLLSRDQLERTFELWSDEGPLTVFHQLFVWDRDLPWTPSGATVETG